MMPCEAQACRKAASSPHCNVAHARECNGRIVMCTAGKSMLHYNGTTGTVEALPGKRAMEEERTRSTTP